jgi:hypothetical protein
MDASMPPRVLVAFPYSQKEEVKMEKENKKTMKHVDNALSQNKCKEKLQTRPF